MSIKPVQIAAGVYQYGKQVGTRDMPTFVKEFNYRRIRTSRKQQRMLGNIHPPVVTRQSFREQLKHIKLT